MQLTIAVFALATLVTTSWAAAAETLDPISPQLIVRSYAGVGEDVREAQKLATAILRGTGIAVKWLECALPETVDTRDACGRALAWNQVILRFEISGSAEGHRGECLGFALVNVGERSGVVATVFADRVAATARRTDVSHVDLLGRAIAHEIGHLLLGTNQHGPRGLMRKAWSRGDLQRNAAMDWRFVDSEGAAMRAGLLARADGLK